MARSGQMRSVAIMFAHLLYLHDARTWKSDESHTSIEVNPVLPLPFAS